MKRKPVLISIFLFVLTACTTTYQSTSSGFKSSGSDQEFSPTDQIKSTEFQSSTGNTISIKENISDQWNEIYSESSIWKILIDSSQNIWALLDNGLIAEYDNKEWIFYDKNDYGFTDFPSDIALAPDNSIWVIGRYNLSHYIDNQWVVTEIPTPSQTASPKLVIDSTGSVWIATPQCQCGNSLRKFDGNKWDEFWLWSTEEQFETKQILFSADGSLWASFGWPDGIGQYIQGNWKIISGSDIWPETINSVIRIASDKEGNIYAINADQNTIVKINKDGSLQKIPFDLNQLEFNPVRIRLFIDSNDIIWMNACNKKFKTCLEYYENGQWYSFDKLPFTTVTDINELANGNLLFATVEGLFEFNLAN
jgi:ligand-binding sensor domain-containing protein